MRPTSLIALPSVAIALCGALLQACGGGDEPAWAVQHATLEITNDGAEVAGYQIWEFYNSAWERTRSQDDHVCARVQSVYGAAEAVLPEGCPGCVASYAVALEELQTDCVGPEASASSYAGVVRYAIGGVDRAIADDDPYPGDSLGWYVGWDDGAVVSLGFAWNDTLNEGQTPASAGWIGGEAYTLSPAFVWDLSASE